MQDETKETIVTVADANGGVSPCAEEDAQKRLGAHPQGVSNTPVITSDPNQGRCVEAIVDYLKVVFLYPFEEHEPETMKYWNDALDALLVDRETRVDMRRGGSNYESGWHYHEDLFVFTGGELTKTSGGIPTSMLEMKGRACERFGERAIEHAEAKLNGRTLTEEEKIAVVANAWKNLFAVLRNLPHRCTRIDLTVDDFNGNMPIAELMRKCKRREFVSSMKKGFDAGGVPMDWADDEEDAVIREGLGWSFTLGKTESERQLCIYDKKAEWTNGNKGVVTASSWIRFESRFKSDRAEFMLDAFIDKLTKSEDPAMDFRRFVIGALSSVIEFKEERLSGENTYRSETWKPWAEFIKEGEFPPKFKAKKPTRTIVRNARWEKRDVSRCHFRMRMARKEEFDEIDAYLFVEGMNKADGDDLAIINADRVALGREPYASLEELKAEGAKRVPGDGTLSKPTIELFEDPMELTLAPMAEGKKEGGKE